MYTLLVRSGKVIDLILGGGAVVGVVMHVNVSGKCIGWHMFREFW